MIDVKNAVHAAIQYCGELFGGDILNRFQLEEVELSDDEKHWFITVGYDDRGTPQDEAATRIAHGLLPRAPERKYKVVDVDAETGKVKKVKIRQPLERVS